MSIELKPCPFCGKTSEVRVVAASDMLDSEGNGPFPHEESYAVICDASTENDCRGCGGASGYFSSERQAIRAWNTRSDSAAQAEIARLQARVAELEAARVTLVVQLHEALDQIERTLHLFRGDAEGRKQAEGCIEYARKVTAPFNYNGGGQ